MCGSCLGKQRGTVGAALFFCILKWYTRLMETTSRAPKYFIGFILPTDYRDALLAQTRFLPGMWESPASINDLHLTAYYLGEVASENLDAVIAHTESLAAEAAPITFDRGKTVIMQPYKPYMLWVKFAPQEWYTAFVRGCETRFVELSEGGDVRSNRIPNPHITLARMPRGMFAPSLIPPVELPEMLSRVRMDTLALWKNEGGVYTVVRRFPLAG